MKSSLPARRTAAAAAALGLGALALTGCGSDGGKGADAAPAAQSASSPSKAAAAPVTVTDGVDVSADAALNAALPEAVRKAGVIRAATDVPYPPYEMFKTEGSQEIVGLDVDIAHAIGAKLGVKVEFSPAKFDGLLPAVQAGKFDIVLAGMTDKKEREQAVDFVDYVNSNSGLLVAHGNPAHLAVAADLCGKAVAVQSGTNQLKLLQDRSKDCTAGSQKAIDIKTFPKDSDAQLALRSGQVVADVLNSVTAAWAAKTADGGKTFDVVAGPEVLGAQGKSPMGIAVSKDLPQLGDAMVQALQALMDDGSYKKILDKYGVPFIAIPKAEKNQAVD
ncbi:ABC transporter substrate-binding protein [Streptacidiphilus sp. ASG 303]|uniref:ABC transporter substrate-binding protein n=1 Tax=Streptacidiphilus sp. ASG 303 TaxID=2896847 RepID=UPI001E446922|nr:ABC transporter substrate-binding protein [Streptacidiphilus sp. ASG 303]MCD0480854.1 ABC transporter substrate-binding protein [Streptacidiphilus sp. ASG 303]